jgi:hypothetical protein
MTCADMIAIRRRLRDVNIEYSGWVRNKLGEGRCLRMEALKAERDSLISLIVESEKSGLRSLLAPMAAEATLHVAH